MSDPERDLLAKQVDEMYDDLDRDLAAREREAYEAMRHVLAMLWTISGIALVIILFCWMCR